MIEHGFLNRLLRSRGRAALTAAALVVLLSGADVLGQSISAQGTSEQVLTGAYAGWYRYDYTITWSGLPGSLNQADVLLQLGCGGSDRLYAFPTGLGEAYDGRSTGAGWQPGDALDYTVPYGGELLRSGDGIPWQLNPMGLAYVKYEPLQGVPGGVGTGQFSFLSNVVPMSATLPHGSPPQVLTDFVVGSGGDLWVQGNLTGDFPSGTLVPEPATAALLGMGLGALLLRRRFRQASGCRSRAARTA